MIKINLFLKDEGTGIEVHGKLSVSLKTLATGLMMVSHEAIRKIEEQLKKEDI